MAALTVVLDAIFASTWPLSERRRFAASAIRMSLGGTPMESHACQPVQVDLPIVQLEEALCAVQRHGRLDEKPSISAAKDFLRKEGQVGLKLAARISKLSKVRNSAAHPDVNLLTDIAAALDHLTDASTDIETKEASDEASVSSGAIVSEEEDGQVSDGNDSADDSEELKYLPLVQMKSDPFFRKKVAVKHDGGTHLGIVQNVCIGVDSNQRCYDVIFDDGDRMHATADQLAIHCSRNQAKKQTKGKT